MLRVIVIFMVKMVNGYLMVISWLFNGYGVNG